MPTIEFEGKTTEEAIEKACNQLHVTSDQLKFEIISTGSSGIFGLGSKKAAIRVTVEEKLSGPRPEAREREEQPREQRPRREERRDPRERDQRRDRKPKRDRPRQDRRRTEPERETEHVTLEPAGPMPLPPTMVGPGESVYDGPEDEIMVQARESLSGILERMEIEAKVGVSRIEDRIILNVEGDNSGLLIGKKGATLDALQFLINKIVNRTRDEKYRVIVDTENYRQRRHQSLIDLAHRMAEKAKRNKKPVTISQLSAHDRRVVHLALQEQPDFKTRSRGDGPMKNVVIIPGGKKDQRNRPPKREPSPRALDQDESPEPMDEAPALEAQGDKS
jgi:spoIIIJ-associated protein